MVSSITEFVSYFEAGEDMTDEEYGMYMRAIHRFAYQDIEPDYTKLPPLVKAALRTVIASVRKNKEDRENGAKGGRPRVSEEPKGGLLEKEKGGYFFTETNEKENEKENENENSHTESKENGVCDDFQEKISIDTPSQQKKSLSDVQKLMYNAISEHNRTAKRERMVPISRDFISFVQKESRELLSTIGTKEKPERIYKALLNFLKVARSDTWQKTFSFKSFVKNYENYTPEYFILSRYLQQYDTDDASKRPDTLFFHAHKDDPYFSRHAFRDHKIEWEQEGRPDGEDYYRLQAKWIQEGPPPECRELYTQYDDCKTWEGSECCTND